jgi:hypothetical protein
MFTIRINDHTIEMDISDWDSQDEVLVEAVLQLEYEDIKVDEDDLKLEDVQIYTSNNNINSLEGGVDWKDLYAENYSHIKDFVDLPNDNDRVVALYLHIEEGLALDIACGEAKGNGNRIHKNEGEVVDEFIDMERIGPRVAKMIDAEKILDTHYPNRFRLPDGKVYAALE